MQCNVNYMEMKKINYMLEIGILRNFSQNLLGFLRNAFSGFGCPKRHPEAFWLRPWIPHTNLKRICVRAYCAYAPHLLNELHDNVNAAKCAKLQDTAENIAILKGVN